MVFLRGVLRTCARPALAAAVLWPGAAQALGDGVQIECAQQIDGWGWRHYVLIMAGVAAAIVALTLLAWGAHRLWQRRTGWHTGFSFPLAAVIITGLLLVGSGLFLTPNASGVYESFGVDVSGTFRILMDYPFLLALPLILFPFLLLRVENDPHREQYFAAFAALEFALLCMAQWVIHNPIVIAC
jgi:hypothetical protein